jgi:hypothetical protein
MSLVTVKPLPTKKWHGKTGAEAFAQPRKIEVLYDNATGAYATGLTEEEEKEYSKKLGNIDLSNVFKADEPHPFWSTKAAWIELGNATKVFDTKKPMDFVKVKNLRASKFVANSQEEANEGKYPEATHVIFDEEEEMTIKANRGQKMEKLYIALGKLTTEDKINLILVVSNKNFRGRSINFIDGELSTIVDNTTDEKSANIDDLLKVLASGREDVSIRAKVHELLIKNILTKQGTNISYMGEVIGSDIDDAVKWFQDPNNINIRVNILDKLNRK